MTTRMARSPRPRSASAWPSGRPTKNEILTALNKPDEFILAAVIIDQDTKEVRYCRTPFEREPDFKATSVNYDLNKLLAQAKEPA